MWTDAVMPQPANLVGSSDSKIMWGLFVVGTIMVLFQVAEVLVGWWISHKNQASLEDTIIRSLGRFTPLRSERMVDPTGRAGVDITSLGVPGSAGVSVRAANKNAKIGEPGGVVIDGFASVTQDQLLKTAMST